MENFSILNPHCKKGDEIKIKKHKLYMYIYNHNQSHSQSQNHIESSLNMDLQTILTEINTSLASTSESIQKIQNSYRDESSAQDDALIKKLQSHLSTDNATGNHEKVSLLSLKNDTLLAYINSLLLIIGNKLNINDAKDDDDLEKNHHELDKYRENTIQHRIVMERGIKPLEKKLNYQLDKLVRTYTKLEKDYLESEKRALEKLSHSSSSSDDDNDDSDQDSSDEDEKMVFKPNISGLLTKEDTKKSKRTEIEAEAEMETEAGTDSVYKPPKINAIAPPKQTQFVDRFDPKYHKDNTRGSRMQAMEEYLRESSDQPDWESSIGANIVNSGRGGIKSHRDTEVDRKMADFEEENMTRLGSGAGSKLAKKKMKQRERYAQMNIVGGEDFSIFNSKRKLESTTSRRGNKKSRNAWERAKQNL
ncbi:hypothetical protein TBLA_0D02260 [Henningerozyma blattae CBS 6284]|uniref:Uncharacterized protein n=1 Tax=Henningerozyma blattae (strain ATCC 34711 / CBS 6284 / DSM 70876 / NBRC 10599 / NRRL Y-10934 / UCD 77-7) TaxID=1071380 RepID=I2H2X8_HENB6|nr:hypothetical protein TBLA_0D02260 [Tetrapisispora blattae CBS 6284]CCH60730.1 hypothetical protein TBLA_0D02260 [Tetrapisispora blattae CBS 6284]